jgi:tape measure domain-containing protein
MADYSVKAILSAVDKNFTSTFAKADRSVVGLQSRLSRGFGFGLFAGAGQAAFNKVTSAIGGMKNELIESSRAWQNFEANMRMNGHTRKEIAETRKDLQRYAEQTIYSSSDMASTFAQFDAVGVKSSKDLVKAFGGLAAASENPRQAMKTLSVQGVQMAAKPKVAWLDFKFMLEQTPAGMSKVAKAMGMTTKELVANVQAGKVKSEDFFAAVRKAAGTGSDLQKMATQYKDIWQALDGLRETVSNKLQPAFRAFNDKGIKVVTKATNEFSDAVDRLTEAFEKNGLSGVLDELTSSASKLPAPLKEIAAVGGAMAGIFAGRKIFNPKTFGLVSDGIGLINHGIKSIPAGLDKATEGLFKLQTMTGRFDVGSRGNKIWQGIYSQFEKASVMSSSVLDKMGSALPNRVTALGSRLGGAFSVVGGKVTGGLAKVMGLGLRLILPAALIATALAGLGVLANTYGDKINDMIKIAAEKGPEVIANFTKGVTSKLPDLINSGSQLLINFLSGLAQLLPNVLESAFTIIETLVNGLSANAPNIITSAVEVLSQFIIGIAEHLPDLIATGMSLIASLAQGIAQNFPQIVETAFNALMKFVDGMINNLPQILQAAAQIILSLITGLVTAFPTIIQKGFELILKLAIGIVKAIPQVFKAILGLGKGIVERISNINLLSAGKAVIDGFLSGLTAGFSKVKNFVGGIASWIKKHKGPIDYDKRLLIPAGRAIMNGLDKGLTSSFSKVKRTVDGMGEQIADSFGIGGQMSFAGIPTATLSSEYDYDAVARYTVVVPVELDGKEIAKATADPMREELSKREKREGRRHGRV